MEIYACDSAKQAAHMICRQSDFSGDTSQREPVLDSPGEQRLNFVNCEAMASTDLWPVTGKAAREGTAKNPIE